MPTDPKPKAYIAGPMRSIGPPNYNAEAFVDAQHALESLGYAVFNPSLIEANEFTLESNRRAMAAELSWICRYADLVIVLPGWEVSLGCAAEMATARSIGIPVITYAEATEALYVA